MPEAKDTYKETCVDIRLHKTKMKKVILQGWMMMAPLYDEEKEKEVKIRSSSQVNLKKGEVGKAAY